MHYTTHYNSNAKNNMAKATRDVMEYMGESRADFTIDTIAAMLKEFYSGDRKGPIYNSIRFVLDFAGIRGMYPVLAIIKMAYSRIH